MAAGEFKEVIVHRVNNGFIVHTLWEKELPESLKDNPGNEFTRYGKGSKKDS